MPYKSQTFDEEPVTRSRRARLWSGSEGTAEWPQTNPARLGEDDAEREASQVEETGKPLASEQKTDSPFKRWPELRHAHGVSFVGVLLFTAVTYFRPYELIPALSGFTTMAFWLAIITLLVFIPTQLSLEGTLTARPREVNLALLLLLMGLLSVPLAMEPTEAWSAFVDFAKVITMFVVMVNVVRSEKRLRAMFWLGLLVAVVLSINAVNDYHLGRFDPKGHRILGALGNLFENPNDMALYMVTVIPLACALLFVSRNILKKIIYGLCAGLLIASVVVTFSRGGFLALAFSLFFLAWKLGRRHRVVVIVLFLAAGVLFLLALPSDFTGRLLTIFGGSDWEEGSARSRQNLLLKSILVTLRHPVLGLGMNNFHNVSDREQVTHNAYTQVSAEMGVLAMLIYVWFIWSAFKRMRQIERETFDARKSARIYYLAVGLQAALVGYMVSSFFASVAYLWYIYYLVGYALCLHRLYEAKGAEGVFSRVRSVGRPRSVEESEGGGGEVSFTEPLAAHLRS